MYICIYKESLQRRRRTVIQALRQIDSASIPASARKQRSCYVRSPQAASSNNNNTTSNMTISDTHSETRVIVIVIILIIMQLSITIFAVTIGRAPKQIFAVTMNQMKTI